MTISNQTRVAVFTGNGATTNFPFTFPIYDSSHLEVRLYTIATGQYVTLSPSDYVATGIGPDSTGGNVAYNPGGVPIPNTKMLAIYRTLPYTQETDIRNQSGFYPDVIEAQLDKIVMQIQQIAEGLSRALVIPPTSGDIDTDEFAALIIQLAAIIPEITTVAGDHDEIVIVAGISDAIEAVAAIADDIAAYKNRYLGDRTALPTQNDDGSPLIIGARLFLIDQVDPDDNGEYRWSGAVWHLMSANPIAVVKYGSYKCVSDGETEVIVPGGYAANMIEVFVNGRYLELGPSPELGPDGPGATASNNTSIIFPAGALWTDDKIQWRVTRPHNVSVIQAAEVQFTPVGGIVATDVQSAIAELDTEKAGLASPAFTGAPTTPTATLGTNTTQIASTAFVKAALDALVDAAPGALDTLNELAAALGDDPNFAATMTTALAAKAPLDSPALTGTPTAPDPTGGASSQIATKGYADSLIGGAANPAEQLISSDAPAAAASLDVELTGSHRRYRLVVDDIAPVTDNQALFARISIDNAATYRAGASDYQYGGRRDDSGGGNGSVASAAANAWAISRNMPTGNTYGSQLEILITPGKAGLPTVISWTASYVVVGTGVFDHVKAGGKALFNGVPTHFRLIFNSGNIAADMTWQLYGLRS